MKDFYDLTDTPSLVSFPWENVYRGLAMSHKAVTTFYGDVHSTEYRHTEVGWADKNSWRWYNALKHGVNVEGFNVNVTTFIGPNWWARNHERDVWKPTINHKHFPELLEWISRSGIFNHTGRILFFIQLAGAGSPQHTDFNPMEVPEHLREPSEFLWITPPDNPKTLIVNGVAAPRACWFNHFKPHSSAPSNRPQWSLRIDGVFNKDFRERLK